VRERKEGREVGREGRKGKTFQEKKPRLQKEVAQCRQDTSKRWAFWETQGKI
jgi:hypothetical protein